MRRQTIQQIADLEVEIESKDINTLDLEKEHAAQIKTFQSFHQEEEARWLKY